MPELAATMELDFRPDDKSGVGTLTVKHSDDALYVDRLNINKVSARNKLVTELTKGLPGVDAAAGEEGDRTGQAAATRFGITEGMRCRCDPART